MLTCKEEDMSKGVILGPSAANTAPGISKFLDAFSKTSSRDIFVVLMKHHGNILSLSLPRIELTPRIEPRLDLTDSTHGGV